MLTSMNMPAHDSPDNADPPSPPLPMDSDDESPISAIPVDEFGNSMRPLLAPSDLVIQRGPRIALPVILFLVTCFSTFFVGAMSWEPLRAVELALTFPDDGGIFVRQSILRRAGEGLTYTVCVISILFAHEMGHYIATRIYKVPSSLPFFIPFPIAPIGTMGAVIAMKGHRANRREIFDIGLAGPIAGLVFAIPIVCIGIANVDVSQHEGGSYVFDMPLFIRWVYSWTHPAQPPIRELFASQMNAMFVAGWVGLLITGLNMLPVSQLDGGHVTYTLFGRYSRWIARIFVVVAILSIVLLNLWIWILMLCLVFLIGLDHPRTSDDSVPLGKFRVALGLVSLLIPFLCFPPRGLFLVGQ